MARSNQATTLAVLDVATAATLAGARFAGRLARVPARWVRPLALGAAEAGAAVTPRVVADALEVLRQDGESAREQARRRAAELWRAAVPAVLDLVLDQVDLTQLVLQRVDLDAVAAALDLDAAASGLDLDAAAARLDIDKILDRIDMNALIEQRVDLDRVAAGLDIEMILDRIDLNGLIEQRVDLDRLARGLEIDPIIARVDLIGLANYVVDGIDLPRIIRESTGSVASESLREVRTRSMEADQALAGLVDRMLLRRRTGRDRAHENGSAFTPGASTRGHDAD